MPARRAHNAGAMPRVRAERRGRVGLSPGDRRGRRSRQIPEVTTMPTIKTILVPIDIAQMEAADAALELARDVAATYGARLVLLNVIEQVPGYVAAQLPKTFHDNAMAEANARLEELASRHRVDDKAEIVVRDGHPSTQILEYASAAAADLIVIASHDPGLSDYFLGSVAARVIRHAHCSVLVVRAAGD